MLWHLRQAAGCDDHGVDLHLLNQCPVHVDRQPHVYSILIKLPNIPGQDIGKLRSSRHLCCQKQLAAEPLAAFAQSHPMSRESRAPRRLKPGEAATHDQDVLGRRLRHTLDIDKIEFAGHAGIDDARRQTTA